MKRMMKAAKNIDEYIALYPPSVQVLLKKIRETIKKAAPDATEAISYGLPTFKFHGNLVHFGGYKTHIGFYPAAAGIAEFPELAPYVTGKGTARFELDQPIPYALITKIVKFRVKQMTK
jgi:uncharacterized protein YdhG (YjbR/CyaY superfamily)